MTSGRSPWWRQRQRERFARAVDASPEADQASDPKLAGELAVVMMLRRSADATAPDKAARDRMRAALFEQLGAEEPAPPTPSPVPGKRPATASRPPGPSHSTRPGRRSSARGRLAIALGAAFCVVLALSGMTLLLSRHALPGDALYGVRRTVESATLGLTSGDNGKGLKHLEFAADRIGDIESLAQRYPDARDSPVGDYLTAFADFDADARAGTTDLTSYATNHGDGVLTTLGRWAAQQAARIARADPALPPAAHTQAVLSTQLLSRIVQRAKAVAARNDCFTITSGATDDLGVVPATGPCDLRRTAEPSPAVNGTSGSIRPTKPGQPGITGPTSAQRAPVQPQQTQTFTTPTEPPATGNPAGGGGSASTTTTKPGITIPLPLPSITIPPLLPGLPGVGIGQ